MHSNTKKHAVKCPRCGKDILDRMEKCPACGCALKKPRIDRERIKRRQRLISAVLWILAVAAVALALWKRFR